MKRTDRLGWFDQMEQFFNTWRFPVFMLATLGISWVLIMFMAWVPVSDSQWGAFAEDFKVWCFGYDPETGSIQWIYLVMFTGNPLMLAVIISYVWNEPLKELWVQGPVLAKGYVNAAAVLVLLTSISFYWSYDAISEEGPEFRAEVLRTNHELPSFTLVNEHEEQVSLVDYRGQVILLTSIYASCADTCPLILDQAKSVLDGLTQTQRSKVVLMAVTMQPEKDTPELLKRVAGFYRLEEYNSHMLTGEPEYVHRLLDHLDVARYLNTETGEIGHANLFMIIDRQGKIAFRFTLGDRQADWMIEAIQLLIEEDPGVITELYGRQGE